MYRLPPNLIEHLKDRGITLIAQIVDLEKSTIFMQAWKSVTYLGIPEQWLQVWEGYITALIKSHVRISNDEYELIWAPVAHGVYSPKVGYTI